MVTGIKNIRDILMLLDKTADQINASLEDGKINVWDIPNFLKIIPQFKDALEEVDRVMAEVKDLDTDELAIIGKEATQIIAKYMHILGKKKA